MEGFCCILKNIIMNLYQWKSMKVSFYSAILLLYSSIIVTALYGVADSQLTYVYSHGLGSVGEHAIFYVKGHQLHNVSVLEKETGQVANASVTIGEENPFYILYHPIHFFNYPSSSDVHVIQDRSNASLVKGKLSPKKASLAQHIEIETLREQIEKISGDCILFGRSMGAATVITYMAQHKPKNVKAIILEAPFDTVENVIRHKIGFWNIFGLGTLYLRYTHPEYAASGIKPGHVAHLIDNSIPILFVHSKKDAFVPVECSRTMYKIIKGNGNPKTHIFELKEAKHNNAGISADAADYQRVVHAFYKEYGLPCNEILAAEGRVLFETTQPQFE